MQIPSFFNEDTAYDWGYQPDHAALLNRAIAYRERHNIRPGASDSFQVRLLLIDLQRDFCFPEGTLFVGGRSGTGAMDDNVRIAEFVYRNLDAISDIRVTLDTHFPFQIFFPEFWIDQDDEHPPANTVVNVNEVRDGTYRPNPAIASWLCNGNYGWLRKQAEFYCAQLEERGKYDLFLWPPHCLLGSEGHTLAGIIQEARMFHAYTRSTGSFAEVKGGNYLTENYSVLGPEVLMRHDGRALAQKNTRFFNELMAADALVIAGQADSHCVAWTIDDLVNEIHSKDPSLAEKVYILEDCMSAVAIPDGQGGFVADFTPQAEKAHERFADAGMHLVKSTVPIGEWKGIDL